MKERFLAVLDPNWSSDSGGGGRGAQNHYALDNVDAIAFEYLHSGHWKLRCDALVFMWATALSLMQRDTGAPDAYVLTRLLGLRVCASAVWVKAEPHGNACALGAEGWRPPAQAGMGQWVRCEDERLLICRRGDVDPPARLGIEPPRSVIYAPRGEHSEKPERAWRQVIEPIARAVMPGVVGVEFNAREQRAGWSAFGRLDGEDKPLRFAAAKVGS